MSTVVTIAGAAGGFATGAGLVYAWIGTRLERAEDAVSRLEFQLRAERAGAKPIVTDTAAERLFTKRPASSVEVRPGVPVVTSETHGKYVVTPRPARRPAPPRSARSDDGTGSWFFGGSDGGSSSSDGGGGGCGGGE